MRLRTVNLSGFKSFVDPTSISLPGSLIGVVGPNGCGKSNIIDAVRWVMGEISAKHLRGDMMSDVIFNGSTSRKPVGQASVELIFDNAEGRLGARWASYGEISVKRQVARDGHSVFMLNGTRCRRRDIMDIFLGTGLGPRSYAIIEQGTISRLIEAKPEELRQFLEEAAGISKYKERRRETENRMRRTEENLERLGDLREELGAQLQRLKRQATMAKRFKVLKEEERHLRAQLLALRWRDLDRAATGHEVRIAAQETVVAAALAEQRRTEAELERQRAEQTEGSDRFNDIYRQVLETGAEIGRAEESIQHLRRQREQQRDDLEREEKSLAEAARHLELEASRLEALRSSLDVDAPELLAQEGRAAAARTAFEESERAVHEFQVGWEEHNRRAAELRQTAHGERTRIEHLEAQINRGRARLERLGEEGSRLAIPEAEGAVARLEEELATAEAAQAECGARVREQQSRIQTLREDVAGHASRLDRLRRRHQEESGRLASLKALQQSALRAQPEAFTDWLAENGPAGGARLAEVLRVESGWERAVEMVLGFHLEGVAVPGLDAVLRRLDEAGEGAVTLIVDGEADPPGPAAAGTLAAKLESPRGVVHRLLRTVRVAPGMGEALAMRPTLGEGESAITGDGIWIGADWARFDRSDGAHSGVLAREQEIKSLSRVIAATASELRDVEAGLEAWRRDLTAAEADHSERQEALAAAHRRHAVGCSDLAAARAELDRGRRRADELSREGSELRAQGEHDGAELRAAGARLAAALGRIETVDAERADWDRRRAALQEALETGRESWQSRQRDAYQVGLRVESERTELTALEQGRARNREQVERHRARAAELGASIEGMASPLAEARSALERNLVRHRELEERLKVAREAVEAVDERCRLLERQRNEKEAEVRGERERLEQLRLDGQEALVRRETVAEQLGGAREELGGLLSELADDATEAVWLGRVEEMERRITRLGPINLAAIDELEQQAERKRYLDAQHEDLSEALSTLREAIRKIDRETRARFKETYEQVNRGFETRFPMLFGGGHASLQMTGEDLLSTGVTVVARPPGKRNSTINLLSGGEKALAAIALVFAIFDLNPAPFCLLDEVDAPLDDANVGRFCNLVTELAEQVQVVMVTHNKSTMEITEQLIGVTMVEPGVSRLVAVDMDQAVVMAADG